MKTFLTSLLLLNFMVLNAQEFVIRGRVCDFKTRKELPGATVQLMSADSSVISTKTAISYWQDGERRGERSQFLFNVPKQKATYILKCSFVGFKTTYVTVVLDSLRKREFIRDLPPVLMHEDVKMLKEVGVSATKVQFYYRGDTIVYNADAFVLAEGSMLDALVRQLPGVEIRENGDIYHNGRLVQNLMLNGRDFFRGNKRVMLDNLPTYMVKQVEVYDKLGDRSQFVGTELPGDKEYVMDVKLKKEYSIGWIGNAEAGAGIAEADYRGDSPYLARLFAMRFTDHSQLAFYANVNNLSDRRKPGQEDGWTPEGMSSGTLTQRMAGIDYTIDSRNKKWKLDGDVDFSHSVLDDEQSTDRTNFLTTGDTYERIRSTDRNKNLTLSTGHKLTCTSTRFMLNIKPTLSYHKFDRTGAVQSEAYRDTLINRYLTNGMTRGHDWNMGLSANSLIKFKYNTFDNIEVGAKAGYRSRRDDTFNRYSLYHGSADSPTQYADQYYRNRPDRSYFAEVSGTYNWKIDRLFYLSLNYGIRHSEAEQDSRLYRLDQLADYEQGDLGVLPSVIEYDQIIDRGNSYESRTDETSHTIAPNLLFRYETEKGNWLCNLNIPLTLKHERLDYMRGVTDTTLTRNSVLAGVYDTYFTWESKDRKTMRFGLWYTVNSKTPGLQHMVNVRDDRDPLNIKEGNSGLRNSYAHSWRAVCTINKKAYQRLLLDYGFTDDAIAVGYRYNTETGVRTYKTYNVDGNWNTEVSYYINTPVDRKRRFRFISTTGALHRQSVDLVGVNTGDMAKSTVRTEGVNQELKLDCRIGKQYISAKFNGKWRYVNSRREDFTDLNIWSYDYGVTATFQLPRHFQLATDLTMFSRKGYHEASLNTDDLVWNARLSYTMMHGNLILMLDGFDILGNLSNITYSLNGQGRTEVRRNVLPQYALFHVQYRLNKLPKKKKGQ